MILILIFILELVYIIVPNTSHISTVL